MKKLAILGSTGSIGTQTLQLVRENRNLFSVELLVAGNNDELLIKQALEFKPNAVIIANESKYQKVADVLQPLDIKVFAGSSSVNNFCDVAEIDLVVQAITGFAGFSPTYYAIEAGKPLALANKESLVVGGDQIIDKALKNKVPIIPVDSEHSAIFQCLQGETQNKINRLIITASGGPFKGKDKEFLKNVTVEMALNHPTWKMGSKITIDSATLMNKGFEIIEAKLLFDVDVEKIDVVVHPQSVIHSLVEFEDGSLKAQLGYPSMKIPINYALTYPYRNKSKDKKFDFSDYPSLTFEKPDTKTFRCLELAKIAISEGGSMTTVLNAANEVAVYAFLDKKISFDKIPNIIEEAMNNHKLIKKPSYSEILEIDKETREKTSKIIK